jgi:phosphotransferase system HPr-like phosphotransfer protein
VLTLVVTGLVPSITPALAAVTENPDGAGWKLYTNARFGFSVRYPDDWRLGNPLPDGIGVTLYPSIEHSLVALSGHMNVVSGSSKDRRQTLDEFASAHRRIISDLYGKKAVTVKWRQDQNTTLAGFPAKQVTFTYSDDKQGHVVEHHIMSLGRNEGRGIRVKVPLSDEERLMSTIKKMLETYQPGRDQNAVSPLAPKPESSAAPR